MSHLAAPSGYQDLAGLASVLNLIQELIKTNKLSSSYRNSNEGFSSLISPLFFLSVDITLVGSLAIKCGFYDNSDDNKNN